MKGAARQFRNVLETGFDAAKLARSFAAWEHAEVAAGHCRGG